jgi:putative chitinase
MLTTQQAFTAAGTMARPAELAAAAAALGKYAAAYGITSQARLLAFVAQTAHESDGFKTREEYASGAGYEGRKDLGNIRAGDGRRYKGRGYIQLTGRDNYQAFTRDTGINIVDNPALVTQTAELSMLVSLWYWKKKNLNTWADNGDFKELTRRINGGYNGLQARINYWERLKKAAAQQNPATAPAENETAKKKSG